MPQQGAQLKQIITRLPGIFTWRMFRQLVMIIAGGVIAAFGYSLFQIPFNLAAGGLSGLGIIINYLTGFPAGTLFFVLNIPLLILGYYYLGYWRFVLYTLLGVVAFSAATEFFVRYLPLTMEVYPVSDDVLLNAIYAGVVVGIGNGIIFRAGGSMGGTNITGRILQRKTGVPMSQIYLYTDGIIIMIAGLIFGWATALHSFLALFLAGIATDFVMEGPSTVRTATIITEYPEEVVAALRQGIQRGASYWTITGGYTGKTHSMVFCTVHRPQVNELKHIVATADDKAFVTIGNAHQALGSQFSPLKPQR